MSYERMVDDLLAERDRAVTRAELVKAELVRLREALANTHGGDGTVLHVSRESQDALYAERGRLRHDLTTLQTAYDDEVEHYRVELARLREALEKIAALPTTMSGPPKECSGACWHGPCDCGMDYVPLAVSSKARNIARNALKETT